MYVAAKRAAALAEEGGRGAGSPMPVAEWLPLYGTDRYYPSRRIRRITERVYFKVILSVRSRFISFVTSCLVLCVICFFDVIFVPSLVVWWYTTMTR